VRKVCEHCKQEVQKTPEETKLIKEMMKEIGMKSIKTENIKIYS
jgi:hypothetical protein